MKTTPKTKRPNGDQAEVRVTVVCPHADVCAAPIRQAEMMASVDQLSASVGLMLESQERLSTRLSTVHDELLDHVQTVTGSNEYIVSALRKLGGEQ